MKKLANEVNIMTQKILIVGDCFIDENWLVAKGNTYTSSHTGDIHYLGKHKKLDKRMISLCGDRKSTRLNSSHIP